MNKKQLIVAWVMGILISIMLIMIQLFRTTGDIMGDTAEILLGTFGFIIVPILIIGSLLIYSLRDKNK